MPRIARLLRDNALGLIAITIALSAGAYAVDKAPKNSVVSSSIRTGSVKGVDVKDDSLHRHRTSTSRRWPFLPTRAAR